ncbi:MAG: prolyl oligopeptidase family serine peptidase [Gemmatimonadetes bacterium]|nr:prolyl oligopeptidase family serine peptidase [Gemmatimonadota bacterium]
MRDSALRLLLLLLPVSELASQRVETGFLDRAVTVAGQSYPYQVYVPRSYASAPRWPVILFLHGGGEGGADGLLQTAVGLGPAMRQNPARYPAIVVFPQAPRDSGWAGVSGEMAMAALEQTLQEFRTDPDRVYLTGLSIGGHGSWALAYRHADRFAAVAPICGWVTGVAGTSRFGPALPPEAGAPFEALARRLGRLPVWIFHGEVDPVVPVEQSRRAAATLEAAGAHVRYTELPGTGHNAWDPAYASPEFSTWLFAQRRR